MLLPKKFYNRPTLKVAQDLLGCFLVRRFKNPLDKGGVGGFLKYKIVETEAYNGPKDLASHASIGKTERNKTMFDAPGTIYVYFTYGIHYMLNIVTEEKDYPAAVLIRAVEPIDASGRTALKAVGPPLINGPAKLTKALQIDKSFNGLTVYTKKHGLWIEGRAEELKSNQVVRTTRIGIDYAKGYKDKKWRFYIKGNKFVSKK